MCGIAGILRLRGNAAVEVDVLRTMVRTLTHRGPDDEGLHCDGPIALGARRLSIVDVASGHQPMVSEDGRVVVVQNGEIYNHPLLKSRLEARGRRYRTRCDTETILHGYEEWGESLPRELRGMFAFAVWDRRARRLLLCRDRLGIKPLYYAEVDGSLVFASEVKALLAYGARFAVEERAVECYLRLGYVPGERTLFGGVRKLRPGHSLVVDLTTGTLETKRYWRPEFGTGSDEATDDEVRARFGTLLEEAVAQHRIGEREQGIFLSGGLDSSSLLAIQTPMSEEPVLTLTVGYPEHPESSEFAAAESVARLYRSRHRTYAASARDFAESLPLFTWHMEEPVADMAAIPLFLLARLAREHVTVVHSGEGVDEILGGYGIYRKMLAISRVQNLAGPLASRWLAQIAAAPGVPHRLRRWGELLDKPLSHRHQGVRMALGGGLLSTIGRDGFPDAADSAYRLRLFETLYAENETLSELDRMLAIDLQTWLPDDLLTKADKMTMAASIELRVPFLDHEVVEFALALPENQKHRGGETKYVLRRLMESRLPAEILRGPKRGFSVPVAQWLRSDVAELAKSTILESSFLAHYLSRDKLEEMLALHQSGRADWSTEIYTLLCLASWHAVFRAGAA